MGRTPRRLIGTLIALGALAALPSSAQAITVSGTAAPANPAAGAHSNFNIHIDFGGSGGASSQVQNLTVGLPPGLVGDPTATPTCTVAQLNASTPSTDGCPAATQVGTVSVQAQLLALVPVTVPGKLYNLEPQPGEPARFGIVLHPDPLGVTDPIKLQSAVQLRSDYGLNTLINGITNKTVVDGDTTILSQDITLFGIAPGTGMPFMRNPTSCSQKTVTFSAVDHNDPPGTGSGQASFTPTNCGALDFSPSFTAVVGGPGQTTNGVPTTATTSILQDTGEAGLLKAVVKVPNDLNPNATIFFGAPCDQASFQAGTCPANTVVGSATAASPLLSQPLSGPVSLVASGGPFPNLGLDLRGQLHLLLQGSVDISAGNTVTFDGLPDIPTANFQLTFTPSPGLLGTSRDLCTPPAPLFHADFTGYNGATSAVDAAATVEGCGPVKAKKCKKAKKKKRKHRAAEAKKKHKKKKCKKKKRKKHRK